MSLRQLLYRLDSGVLDRLGPAREFGLDDGGEILWRIADDLETERFETAADIRRRARAASLAGSTAKR
jgi:hypothetical protein